MDLNTDRVCEACGHDWRGTVTCPVCGWLDNLGGVVTLCAWCPSSAALTTEARRQGLDVTHGMCRLCAVRQWNVATTAFHARLAAERLSPKEAMDAHLATFGRGK